MSLIIKYDPRRCNCPKCGHTSPKKKYTFASADNEYLELKCCCGYKWKCYTIDHEEE